MFARASAHAASNLFRVGMIALLTFFVLSVSVGHAKVPTATGGSAETVQDGAKLLTGLKERMESTVTATQPSSYSIPGGLAQEQSSSMHQGEPAVANDRRPAAPHKLDARGLEAHERGSEPAARDEERSGGAKAKAKPTSKQQIGPVRGEAERADSRHHWAQPQDAGEPTSKQHSGPAKDKDERTAKHQPGPAKDKDERTAKQQSGPAKEQDELAAHKRVNAEVRDKPAGTKVLTAQPVAAVTPLSVAPATADPPVVARPVKARVNDGRVVLSVEPLTRVTPPAVIAPPALPAPASVTGDEEVKVDDDGAPVIDRAAAEAAATLAPSAVASVESKLETRIETTWVGAPASQAAKTSDPAPETPLAKPATAMAQRLEALAGGSFVKEPEALESPHPSAFVVLHPTLNRAEAQLEAVANGGHLDRSTTEGLMPLSGGPQSSAIEETAAQTADSGARSDGTRPRRSPSPTPVPDEPAGLLAASSASSGGGAAAAAAAILLAISLSLVSSLTWSLRLSPSVWRPFVLASLIERPD